MNILKNIATAIAVLIGIKLLFAFSAQTPMTPASTSKGESEQIVSLLEATSPQPNPTDGFERLTLSGGMQIDIPLQWEPLPSELNSVIRTTANALLANEGMDTEPDGSRLLLAYTSRPTTTYAAVRIQEIVPSPLSPAELLSASEAEVAAVAAELVQIMSGPMAKQKHDFQPGATTSRELVSGHPALIFRYRRLGDRGIVSVEQIKIMTAGREVSVTLAYREAEAVFWRPVIENIRRSIRVPA